VAPGRRSRGAFIAAAVLLLAVAGAAVAALALRPPPPPAAPATGSVQVDTEPAGARILLDGAPTGLVSPATLSQVALGREHKLRLEKEGFFPKEVSVWLTEQIAYRSTSVSLLPVPPPAPPVEAVAPPPPPPAREPEPEPPPQKGGRAGPAFGVLELDSRPAAQVMYQRRSLGKTPARLRLPVGRVELTLVNAELALTRKVEVEVPSRGVGSKEITFEKGKLAADVKPWADVYVGARKLGTTPLAPRELYEGTYVVKLVNSELGAIKEVKVTVAPGATTVLREELP
jgi:hypothetical protein